MASNISWLEAEVKNHSGELKALSNSLTALTINQNNLVSTLKELTDSQKDTHNLMFKFMLYGALILIVLSFCLGVLVNDPHVIKAVLGK